MHICAEMNNLRGSESPVTSFMTTIETSKHSKQLNPACSKSPAPSRLHETDDGRQVCGTRALHGYDQVHKTDTELLLSPPYGSTDLGPGLRSVTMLLFFSRNMRISFSEFAL